MNRTHLSTIVGLFLGVVLATPAASAEPKIPAPGTVIDRSNIHEYRDLFSPAMLWTIDRGVKIRVGTYKKVTLPPPFMEATEKFSSQVELSEDRTELKNYVAGLPFPKIDANDPTVASKLMFNFITTIRLDDLDLRNFDCDTGAVGRDGDPVTVEKHFLIDHLRRLSFVERTEVDPKPTMPNMDEVRYKEALYPLIEPFDLKGVGFTLNRYLETARHDDTWLYLPQLRRVRRLSSAQRSDALFGQDTDMDSYAGYAGKPAWMEWKFLGEKKVLGSFHSENLPVKWGEPSGDFVHADLWEPRDAWVVEGISKLPQYAYGKRVIFLDKESYRIPFTDIYDTAGELWKMWLNQYKFSKCPVPGADYCLDYEDGQFNPSITMVDVQLEHATFCALPSHRFPGEQGWYVNVGDQEGTTEDYFSLSAIISAGR
ncbi:MAG: DUF1329 domain-containing protein [Candidatus Binatia bacterium]